MCVILCIIDIELCQSEKSFNFELCFFLHCVSADRFAIDTMREKFLASESLDAAMHGKRFFDYQDEFEYLISAGIALDVNAISNPVFPLTQSVGKKLLKLYWNDVGLLTDVLYGSNIRAVLDDKTVRYQGQRYSLSALTQLLTGSQYSVAGPRYFKYKGEWLNDIRHRLERPQ